MDRTVVYSVTIAVLAIVASLFAVLWYGAATENKYLQTSLGEVKAQNQALQSQISALSSALANKSQQLADALAKLQDVQTQLSEKTQQLQQVQAQLQKAEGDLAVTRAELKSTQEELVSIMLQYAELDYRLAQLRAELEEINSTYQRLIQFVYGGMQISEVAQLQNVQQTTSQVGNAWIFTTTYSYSNLTLPNGYYIHLELSMLTYETREIETSANLWIAVFTPTEFDKWRSGYGGTPLAQGRGYLKFTPPSNGNYVLVIYNDLGYDAVFSLIYRISVVIPTVASVKTVTIGALLPLTGALQSYGLGSQCAVQLAVQDANQMFASKGIQFQLVVQDSQCDPNTALQKLQTLYSQGIRFVVGLTCSSELSAVMNFAEQNHILITSISTSPLLAVPKPYIFRLPPTDDAQAQVLAALYHMLGIKRVVIVYRADAWGQGLAQAIINASAKYGIQVVGAFGYDPSPSAMPAAEQAAVQKASAALGTPGPDAAFEIVSFDQDGAAVVQAAMNDPVLSKVRWFGTDSNVYGTAIMQAGGQALATAKFLATIAAPNPNDPRYQKFVQEYKQYCGSQPVAYDPYAYDAAMFIMTAIAETGSTDPTVINSVLEQWGKNGTYVGVTGPVYLDQYHDRIYASYLIMGVAIVNGTPTWINAGFYNGTTGQITVFPQGQALFSS